MLIINSKLTPGLQRSACQPLKEATHVVTDLCLGKEICVVLVTRDPTLDTDTTK